MIFIYLLTDMTVWWNKLFWQLFIFDFASTYTDRCRELIIAVCHRQDVWLIDVNAPDDLTIVLKHGLTAGCCPTKLHPQVILSAVPPLPHESWVKVLEDSPRGRAWFVLLIVPRGRHYSCMCIASFCTIGKNINSLEMFHNVSPPIGN